MDLNDGMRVAVIGCTHGQLDLIYSNVAELEAANGYTIDLVLCCGDFQAIRNAYDLSVLETPNKYRKYGDFYKYYSGQKVAPKLTVFIGGNHEAISHNRELYYGGWAAPNIYFLGYSGVIQVGGFEGLRIAGFSGIYDYRYLSSGHFELTPYGKSELRSAFYVRLYELWKLAHLSGNIDIIMSHDWPEYIAYYGDTELLLKNNPFFKDSLEKNELGCEHYLALMKHLQPRHWFAGHMHTRFEASVPYTAPSPVDRSKDDLAKCLKTKQTKPTKPDADTVISTTQFLALDKTIPKRQYLEVIHFPNAIPLREESPHADEYGNRFSVFPVISYDLQWLSIIRTAHPTVPCQKGGTHLVQHLKSAEIESNRKWIVENCLQGDPMNLEALKIPPTNFIVSAEIHEEGKEETAVPFGPAVGPQTKMFLDWLQLPEAPLFPNLAKDCPKAPKHYDRASSKSDASSSTQ